MDNTAPLRFKKMNGLGNEIVVADLRGTRRVLTGGDAAFIAASPGSHFDQLMVLYDAKTPGTEAFMRIFNTDGSEATACGNGTRCVAWEIFSATGRRDIRLEAVPGILAATVTDQQTISVDMGRPRLKWEEIPLVEEFADTRAIELQVGPIDEPIIHSPAVVNMGNPHAIFFVDRLDIIDLGKIGPMLEHHRLFPDRANISLAHVRNRGSIDLKTWERGAGLTRACGTAACAATVAAVRRRLTDRKVVVNVPAGPLAIEWLETDRVIMTGPVEHEHDGEIVLPIRG
jgi:diaminopimelate epimerase